MVEADGRVAYANQAYLRLGRLAGAEIRIVERLFTGAPDVSEAIYRLAQAARDGRLRSEEMRLSPPLGASRARRGTA